jgi:MFS family permease
VTGDRLYTRAFWLACAVHLTGGMSAGMFLLFPLFIRALGGDDIAIGGVLGAGLAVSVAARPAIGVLLDRVGRRSVLLWASLANAAFFPTFLALSTVGPGLFALATAHLVLAGALFAAYFTYASDLVPAGRRVEGIAVFGIFGMAPNGLGPALGEVLIARTGWTGYFLVAGGFALLSAALSALAREVGPVPHRRAERDVRGLLHDFARLLLRGGLGRIMLATALFGAGINAAFFFIAPFTRDLGIARAAPFFAAYAGTTIALRLFGRRLPDRLGFHPVAVPSFAVFAAGLAALCLMPARGILVAAGVACGAGHGSLFPVLQGIVVTRTPPRLHGTVVSLYTAALDAGAVLGTPLCGALAELAGYRTMFAAMAAASGVALVLVRLDARRSVADALVRRRA